ncbi:MAG: L-serine ammonia-lyase, iron-sulfur-dependent subunit beta [Candidatus Sericytochromatia bacterium]|nr:L-serine ammonia-lyase, iron-sulfur-dependent subunit beta [Candidatus Sericytochromatia bacterium]
MAPYDSVFSIIGPIMVGPSSSHTAGAARLGGLARALLGGTPVRAELGLHGSFAETGAGHGTDRALIAGLLGFSSGDDRLKDAFEHAREGGLSWSFSTVNLGQDIHPCSARFVLRAADGETLDMVGSSLGGGAVRITSIQGYDVDISGDYPTLVTVHEDRPGLVREVTGLLARLGVNIAFMRVARRHRGAHAFMTLESDQELPENLVAEVRAMPGVLSARALPRLA